MSNKFFSVYKNTLDFIILTNVFRAIYEWNCLNSYSFNDALCLYFCFETCINLYKNFQIMYLYFLTDISSTEDLYIYFIIGVYPSNVRIVCVN